MADRGQGFDFPAPEEFGPQSVDNPFAPGTEVTEPGEELGALEVAEPVRDPRSFQNEQATEAPIEEELETEAAESDELAAAEAEEIEFLEAQQVAEEEARLNAEDIDRVRREANTTKLFLWGSVMICLIPPVGAAMLKWPIIAGKIEQGASAIPIINAEKISSKYAPYSPGKLIVAEFLIFAIPTVWYFMVIALLIALAVAITTVSACKAGWITTQVCKLVGWWNGADTSLLQ